ncbi:3-hydroxyacyl-CoA dehydrogenase [Sphingobium jiangsuense]|uniref:NAD(P)-dependent dehydrogenase (Short-subunit alcohol dehydrogenase family) n=1 Tax=Sphingobium jiangsuense TaxID=870476 RepID=A0A7W6BN94_9SPHN|nr:SDR family NAD(P)-dependent oxidoreductase [Sphingobium jiangsuense]MBB3925718.1 NAD(P)-dependent dehydrogenase (short-subunit alcohol dehydrogenase family) [Sphingobium jiangsuense]GLT00389.1 3-hydroxyacyl-CoA dehydrogenase [Sphingobium jiangsuense]
MTVNLTGRVAIVTGAGAGLGRAHALALAAHGAKVVVNDLDPAQAEQVREEIAAAGGEAMAVAASVTDMAAVTEMVARATAQWGAVDILVNNAGILRDKSFAKMDLDDFRLVLDVHLMGSVNCAKAVWAQMRERNYGRIVFTTSSSGLYGNFGQSNYGAAKMALVGLMQTLGLEGARNDIRVNCLAPSAATAMTNGLYGDETLAKLGADLVSPAVVVLAGEDAPTRRILLAGAGSFEQANITMTRGIFLGDSDDMAGDLAAGLDRLADRAGEIIPESGEEQHRYETMAAQRTAAELT